MKAEHVNMLNKLTDSQKAFFYSQYKEKQLNIAYILWFVFGVYYAYFGKWGKQILYWITFGGLTIWAFINLFRMKSLVERANSELFDQAYMKAKIID
jgi:hypothetical protein